MILTENEPRKEIKAHAGAMFAQTGIYGNYQTIVENTGPGRSLTGNLTNVDTALGLAAVWEAVNQISGHIAGMELNVVNDAGEVQEDHPVQKLLMVAPNDWQTAFTFRELLMGHALIQGNGRAKIQRNGLGQPVSLIPLLPWHAWCEVREGEKIHHYWSNPNYPGSPDTTEGNYETFDDADVLHVHGFSYNGFWGIHLTQIATDVLGVASAGQERTASSFANQGIPGFLISLPIQMWRNIDQRLKFKRDWNEQYTGSKNAGKMQMIPEGAKAQAMNVSAQDSQLVELSQFSVEQIRRLFGLPPEGVGAYKSITERNAQYINNCLRRWISKWEEETTKKLILPYQRDNGIRLKFNTDELIKGDPNSWADYTGKLRQQGLINGNEGRKLHGLEPVADEALESYSNPNITAVDDTEPVETENED